MLVPTTTRIINAIPQVENVVPERTKSPIVLELASASLDLMLSPESKSATLQNESDIEECCNQQKYVLQ